MLHGQKWQTVIEAHVDVKITGGYLLVCFLLALLKKKILLALLKKKKRKKMQQSGSEELLCSASTGLPKPKEDDGNHDPRDANK